MDEEDAIEVAVEAWNSSVDDFIERLCSVLPFAQPTAVLQGNYVVHDG